MTPKESFQKLQEQYWRMEEYYKVRHDKAKKEATAIERQRIVGVLEEIRDRKNKRWEYFHTETMKFAMNYAIENIHNQ